MPELPALPTFITSNWYYCDDVLNYAVRRIMCTPLSVSTMSLSWPTASANLHDQTKLAHTIQQLATNTARTRSCKNTTTLTWRPQRVSASYRGQTGRDLHHVCRCCSHCTASPGPRIWPDSTQFVPAILSQIIDNCWQKTLQNK